MWKSISIKKGNIIFSKLQANINIWISTIQYSTNAIIHTAQENKWRQQTRTRIDWVICWKGCYIVETEIKMISLQTPEFKSRESNWKSGSGRLVHFPTFNCSNSKWCSVFLRLWIFEFVVDSRFFLLHLRDDLSANSV